MKLRFNFPTKGKDKDNTVLPKNTLVPAYLIKAQRSNSGMTRMTGRH